ncbi:MAG: TGS domain-containing protein [Microthrixaceae bacterium]
MVDWQEEMTDPGEFMANLKIDLEQDEVFVFTPNGDVVTLPADATPVDFAHSIHTEVGHRCIGARRWSSGALDHKLAVGDTVEIFTSKVEGAGPSQDWLKFVASRSSASKIRQWFSRERREDALESGTEALQKELRKAGLPSNKVMAGNAIEEVAQQLKYTDNDALLTAVGEGHVSAESVAQRGPTSCAAPETNARTWSPAPSSRRAPSRHLCWSPRRGVRRHARAHGALLHAGSGRRDRRVHHPGPRRVGAPFGLLQRRVALGGTGRTDREGRLGHRPDRRLRGSGRGEGTRPPQAAAGGDRSALEHRVNIVHCTSHAGPDRAATMRFEFELGDASHLETPSTDCGPSTASTTHIGCFLVAQR